MSEERGDGDSAGSEALSLLTYVSLAHLGTPKEGKMFIKKKEKKIDCYGRPGAARCLTAYYLPQ